MRLLKGPHVFSFMTPKVSIDFLLLVYKSPDDSESVQFFFIKETHTLIFNGQGSLPLCFISLYNII